MSDPNYGVCWRSPFTLCMSFMWGKECQWSACICDARSDYFLLDEEGDKAVEEWEKNHDCPAAKVWNKHEF